jgi:hypothetical protein
MSTLKLGVVGDGGTIRVGGSTFYYSPEGGYAFSGNNLNNNVTSTGPAQDAVVELVRKAKPDQFINLGDLVYNTGSSTTFDENVGRLFNDYMGAYPSPYYLQGDYLAMGPTRATAGQTSWPFNIYNFPQGYPSLETGKLGGSADGVNKFWPTIGNHEYYLRTSGQGDTNISLHTEGSTVSDQDIKGQTSTPVPQPFVDYFAWLRDPRLANNTSLSIGSADGSGHSGVYYKVSLGGDANGKPLVDLFSIDAMRLVMNRGGKYPTFTDGFGPVSQAYKAEMEAKTWNLQYDPSLRPRRSNKPFIIAANSNDPTNGWKQFNWLKSELEKSKAHWKIIVGHQPIYGSGSEDGQLDDNNNNPELQRFLNGLPENSFDMYMNGHAHFYQRVLEQGQAGNGIGPGIPFISIGSSGRKQDSANPSVYGRSTYDQPEFYYSKAGQEYKGTDAFMRKSPAPGAYSAEFIKSFTQDFVGNDIVTGVPYSSVGFAPYLLASNPTTVGFSAGRASKKKTAWEESSYGFGFGGATISVSPESLLFHYETTEIPDPAIKDNLDPRKRLPALSGWDKLTANDWTPKDPITGQNTSSLANTAIIALKLEPADQGRFLSGSATVAQGGAGYMAAMAGNHVVDFEIRGNDPVTGQPINPLNPGDVAIVRLTFSEGKLNRVELVNDGSGYVNLGQLLINEGKKRFYATSEFSELSEPQVVKVPIHYSFTAPLYGTSTKQYDDRYLITQTEAKARLVTNPQGSASLEVQVLGKGQDSQQKLDALTQPSQWTTGYSGLGQQRGYDKAQKGAITVRDSKGATLVQDAQLNAGLAVVPLPMIPEDRRVEILFGGDPFSSYLVNFKPSATLIDL